MFRYPNELSVTSADAAGLPIFPGLVRYSEVAAGNITHAVRFTLPTAQRAYIPPAKHYGSTKDASYLPYGARFRLKASFDLSTYTGQSLIILKALKKYGMIFADQGSSYFITGEPNDKWDSDDLNQLKKVPGTAFDMVRRTGKIVRDWTTATDSCNGQSTQLIYTPNYVCNNNNNNNNNNGGNTPTTSTINNKNTTTATSARANGNESLHSIISLLVVTCATVLVMAL